jgi:hypothetical protein
MSTQKKYLDSAGLTALWDKIKTGFAPRWSAYKPGALKNEPQTIHEINASDSSLSADQTTIDINFVSAGILTNGGTKYGTDILVRLPQAVPSSNGSNGTAGLLSATDKEKIDLLDSTTENAVTIKGVHVGKADNGKGTSLTPDDNKFAHFNFVYNDTTKSLDITDCNSGDAVLATVPLSHFTEDLAISGIISSADVLAELPAGATLPDGTKQNPPYLALTFILTREGINAETGADETITEKNTIYTSLADLISTYTASTGLELITLAGDDLDDDTHTTAAFRLKSAATTERGGIKVIEVTTGTETNAVANEPIKNTSDTKRYFGVEINDNDVAFVNVPIGNLSCAAEIDVKDKTIDVKENAKDNIAQTFTIIKGLNAVKDDDCQGNTITYITEDISILPENDLTVTKDATNDTAENYNNAANPKHKLAEFDVVSSIKHSDDANGHNVTYKTKTVTIHETELDASTTNATESGDHFISVAGHVTGGTANENENVTVSGDNDVIYLSDITVNNHTITKTFKKAVFSTPTIPVSVIEALTYPII